MSEKQSANGTNAWAIESQGSKYKVMDKTYLKGMSLGGHGAMPACIDVMNGKIVRIRHPAF